MDSKIKGKERATEAGEQCWGRDRQLTPKVAQGETNLPVENGNTVSKKL